MGKIPHVFFQTTKDGIIDNYVIDMIHQHLDDTWSYKHFSNEDQVRFLTENPIDDLPDVVNKYHSLVGAHKSDLFRYYYLYLKGGFYLDSDAMIYYNINDITKNYEFVTANSCISLSYDKYIPDAIFNGFIAAVPRHKIMKEALYNAYYTDPIKLKISYYHWCKELFVIVQNNKDIPNIKIYREKYGALNGDETIDDNGIVLIKHYPKTKIIPCNMVGHTYSWGTGTISFNGASKITTTWGNGNYVWLNSYTVEVHWNGYSHIMVFNQMYTQYVSTRKNDLDYVKGSIIPSLH
jgi:hypothetical protein